mmetsp:Transcript_74779/g.207946  ORF Transcript_74779/g.207946 Transcript_74779/m.207946 type:complete len:221 (-) Transcript_74779:1718-2380(-)
MTNGSKPAGSTLKSWLLNNDNAVSTLSVITFPSCPVMVSLPLPAQRQASMKRSWPPVAETLSPMATPTSRRSAMSWSNSSAPMICCKWCASTTICLRCPCGPQEERAASRSASNSAVPSPPDSLTPCNLSAAHRHSCASRRSNDRTPLSAVHLVTRFEIASGVSTSRGSSALQLPPPAGEGASCGTSLQALGTASASSAWSRRCLGNKCVVVIAIFSSTV